MEKLIRGIFSTAALRYVLAAIGGALLSTGKVQPDEWETISGALLVLLPTAWGIISSFQSRIVTESGQKVTMPEIAKADPRKKTMIEEAAQVVAEKKKAARKPNLLDWMFGETK